MDDEFTERGEDDVLGYFLRSVERDNGALNITIQIPGAILTGEAISARRYLRELSEFIGRPVKMEDEPLEDRLPDFDEIPFPEFIHLRDGRYVFGDRLVPDHTGVLWRGRVADVTGYSVGTLGVQRP